ARRLGAAGAVAELLASRLIEQRPGLVTKAYTTGRAHRLRRSSEYLTLGGAVAAVSVARRSRLAAAAAGLALLAGSVLQRFGTFEAGVASTKDPAYVVVPQRERLEAGDGERHPPIG
ncbi:MAG TPA: polysulfide reductase, partial [Streptosporangiaceae bacterium]|nr:polysulfide reductase [Streptosporangiaceae bacterium]